MMMRVRLMMRVIIEGDGVDQDVNDEGEVDDEGDQIDDEGDEDEA